MIKYAPFKSPFFSWIYISLKYTSNTDCKQVSLVYSLVEDYWMMYARGNHCKYMYLHNETLGWPAICAKCHLRPVSYTN